MINVYWFVSRRRPVRAISKWLCPFRRTYKDLTNISHFAFFAANVGANRPRGTHFLFDFPIPLLAPRARGPVQRLVGPYFAVGAFGSIFVMILPFANNTSSRSGISINGQPGILKGMPRDAGQGIDLSRFDTAMIAFCSSLGHVSCCTNAILFKYAG